MSQALETSHGEDQAADDLVFFGAVQAAEEYSGEDEQTTFRVEPENWPAVQAFLRVQSQFRRSGLRYEGVEAGLRMARIKRTDDLFSRIQMIEAGALRTLAARDG